MAYFNSYVKLPDGILNGFKPTDPTCEIGPQLVYLPRAMATRVCMLMVFMLKSIGSTDPHSPHEQSKIGTSENW